MLAFEVQVDAGVCCEPLLTKASIDSRKRVTECLWTLALLFTTPAHLRMPIKIMRAENQDPKKLTNTY